MASDILLISLMTFQSVNTLFIEVDIDPALGFIIGFRIFTYCTQKFHYYQRRLGKTLSPLLSDICGKRFYIYYILVVVVLNVIIVTYIINSYA